MLKKVISLIILSLIFIQCDIPESEDRIPPQIELVFPKEGTVLSASTLIKIEAFDDEIDKVWAYVDGDFIGETDKKPENSNSYEIAFDITPYQDVEQHFMQVFASDKTGNISGSDAINFVIAETDDNIDPVISIVNPQSGQTVEDIVKVVAIATDDRSIQKVAFFIDGDSMGLDNSYPYNYDWDTQPYADSTNHTIYAKAFDTGNNTSVSGVVSVTVYPSTDITPPSALITYPLNAQVVFDTVLVTVEASDNKGLAMVEFFVDGQMQYTDTQYPYQFEWNTAPYADGGSHSIYAKAYDLSGNISTTSINTVTVSSTSSDDITPPMATILYPLSGSNVNGIVNIVADVVDDRGMGYVEFYIDGILRFTDNDGDGTWTYAWNATPFADGQSHTIYLKAYDAAGNSSSTPLVTVVVTQNVDITPPIVIALYPISSTTVSGTVNIRADALDDFGVDYVEFYIDGNFLSTDNNGTDGWSASWDTAPYADNNSHSVYIKAFDEAGNVGTTFVSVVVTP